MHVFPFPPSHKRHQHRTTVGKVPPGSLQRSSITGVFDTEHAQNARRQLQKEQFEVFELRLDSNSAHSKFFKHIQVPRCLLQLAELHDPFENSHFSCTQTCLPVTIGWRRHVVLALATKLGWEKQGRVTSGASVGSDKWSCFELLSGVFLHRIQESRVHHWISASRNPLNLVRATIHVSSPWIRTQTKQCQFIASTYNMRTRWYACFDGLLTSLPLRGWSVFHTSIHDRLQSLHKTQVNRQIRLAGGISTTLVLDSPFHHCRNVNVLPKKFAVLDCDDKGPRVTTLLKSYALRSKLSECFRPSRQPTMEKSSPCTRMQVRKPLWQKWHGEATPRGNPPTSKT